MITRLELKELASHTLDDAHFVSLFLNVDPKQVKQDEWQLHFKNLARRALAAMPNGDRPKVAPDLDRLERYLADHPNGLKRGLAVVSCCAKDFWWVYHSALPFMADLVIKRDPYIKPLMQQLDQYQRYLVVVVGAEEARFFVAGMGTIQEVTDIYRPLDVSNATRDGGRGDMGALRAQRRKDNNQRILFKDAAAVMERLLTKEEIKRALLGGTDAARGHFKEVLPEPLRHKVVADFHIDRNAGHKEVLDLCLPMMKDVEFQFERKALAELFNRVGLAVGGSVLGLSDVLAALQQGNVRKIFVMTNLADGGMACDHCGALTPRRDRSCPYCGGKMLDAPFIFDLAIQKAIEQGARVDLLEDAPELVKAGGIAAMLRY